MCGIKFDQEVEVPEMRVIAGRAATREALEPMLTGSMTIEGRTGDVRVTWNARDNDEVEAARSQFNDLRGKRFLAFAVNSDGSKGEQIDEFDPDAQKIIMAPPMAGGDGTARKMFHWEVGVQDSTGAVHTEQVAVFWSPDFEGVEDSVGWAGAGKTLRRIGGNGRIKTHPLSVTRIPDAA